MTWYHLLMMNEGGNKDDWKSYTFYDLVMADGPVAWESKNSLQLTGTGDEYMGV
jgi:hypothetical protein